MMVWGFTLNWLADKPTDQFYHPKKKTLIIFLVGWLVCVCVWYTAYSMNMPHLKHSLICSALSWFKYISLCSSLRRNSMSHMCQCFSLRKNLGRIIIQWIGFILQKDIKLHHIAAKSPVHMYTLIASFLFSLLNHNATATPNSDREQCVSRHIFLRRVI